MERTQLVLIEDDRRYLDEVKTLLTGTSLVEVVGTYTTGKAAIAGILGKRPQIALIDLGLPDINGEEVIRYIKQQGCETEVLVLTSYDDDGHLFPALKAGAVGYVVKSEASLLGIIQTIQEVRNGGSPMSPGIARRILHEFRTTPLQEKNPLLEKLTKRELEILEYCAKGFSARQLARHLQVSYETIRCHQKTIYSKLQVHSAMEAVAVFRGDKR